MFRVVYGITGEIYKQRGSLCKYIITLYKFYMILLAQNIIRSLKNIWRTKKDEPACKL